VFGVRSHALRLVGANLFAKGASFKFTPPPRLVDNSESESEQKSSAGERKLAPVPLDEEGLPMDQRDDWRLVYVRVGQKTGACFFVAPPSLSCSFFFGFFVL
jgi:hypothetical protein